MLSVELDARALLYSGAARCGRRSALVRIEEGLQAVNEGGNLRLACRQMACFAPKRPGRGSVVLVGAV